jgi:hypothetical protein
MNDTTTKEKSIAEQNRLILIRDAIDEFDKDLCLAVKEKIEERLAVIIANDTKNVPKKEK